MLSGGEIMKKYHLLGALSLLMMLPFQGAGAESKLPLIQSRIQGDNGVAAMITAQKKATASLSVASQIAKAYVETKKEGFTNDLPKGTTWEKSEVIKGKNGPLLKVYLDIPSEVLTSKSLSPYDLYNVEQNLFASLENSAPEIAQINLLAKDPENGVYTDLKAFLPAEPKSQKKESVKNTKNAASWGQGKPSGSLDGKAVVLNQAHGFYDHRTLGWTVQRTYIEHSYEDFHNAEMINQFLVPYLYNAGASVWTVREHDMNENMVIVDNEDGTTYPSNGRYEETGSWLNSSLVGYKSLQGSTQTDYDETQNPFTDGSTRYLNNNNGTESATASWTPNLPAAGYYNVYVTWAASSLRADSVHYQVHHTGGSTDFYVNQKINDNTWFFLGNFYFDSGTNSASGSVELINDANNAEIACADAVRFGGGMSNVRRTDSHNTVSGKARWEEDAVYNIQYMGTPQSTYYYTTTSNNADEQRGWSARPKFAGWCQGQEGLDTVYVAWHTNAAGTTARGYRTYVSESGRTMDYDYRDAVHDRMTYECENGPYAADWYDGDYKKVASYGENNPSHLGSNVAGFLIEAIFHDNEDDMNLYRNPYFRQFMAKSFYHGVIDYFNNRDYSGNHTLKYLPESPTLFTAINNGNGSVTLDWNAPTSRNLSGTAEEKCAGDAATSYKVYLSRNGYGFDNGQTITASTLTLSGLEIGGLYHARVTALNSGGESFATETLSFTASSSPTKLLIVSGFDRFDKGILGERSYPQARDYMYLPKVNMFNYCVPYAQAIVANGAYCIDSTCNEAVSNGTVNLADYDSVFWFTGEESTYLHTFDSTEQSLVSAYLTNGGNLFVTGSELGWDLAYRANGTSFYANQLHAAYVADDSNSYTLSGVSGGIFATLPSFTFDDESDFGSNKYYTEYPDAIGTSSGSQICLNYGSGQGAAVQYSGAYKVVYFGFPFECIESTQMQEDVMEKVLGFFSVDVSDWELYQQ